jgi:very-short-patch-repair endonuclease
VEQVATREKVLFAREQRREGSGSEGLVWKCLRGEKLGFRFRRQHPIGDFVLDFFCHAARLAVEIDGPDHAERQEYDRWRDECLSKLGIHTLRVPVGRVDSDLVGLLDEIVAACQARV